MKLRLLITEKCNRNCEGCCNKDWDLDSLPIVVDSLEYSQYEEILLTGGEPLLDLSLCLKIIEKIRCVNPKAKIYIYTAMSERVLDILPFVDGITLTLHEQKDILPFDKLDQTLQKLKDCFWVEGKSYRLNVFENVKLSYFSSFWDVKDNMKRIKNCPLPDDEVFKKV